MWQKVLQNKVLSSAMHQITLSIKKKISDSVPLQAGILNVETATSVLDITARRKLLQTTNSVLFPPQTHAIEQQMMCRSLLYHAAPLLTSVLSTKQKQ